MSDQLLTFSFPKATVRGALVKTKQSFQALTQQHGNQDPYPLFIRQLLGEMNILLVLMASNLKLVGTMSLQLRGQGYLYSAITDIALGDPESLQVRGLARRSDQPQPSSLDLRDWVGAGASLAITLQPAQGKPYQGVIPLESPRLTQSIEDYYGQSEQIPTQFWTQVTQTDCAGFMLQALPSSVASSTSEFEIADDEIIDLNTACLLANTLRPGELIDTAPEDLLQRLFHEFPVLVHKQRHLRYHCNCTARMKETLLSLSLIELKTLAEENPAIEMTCQMCGQTEVFNAHTLIETLQES